MQETADFFTFTKEIIKRYTLRSETIFGKGKTFKRIKKMLFISACKLFSFSRYLNFLSWLFCHVENRLNEKDKVNFKICDVTGWKTSNCNTRIAISQEVKASRQ